MKLGTINKLLAVVAVVGLGFLLLPRMAQNKQISGLLSNFKAADDGLSRNFHSLTRESTVLVLLFCEFIGMKAAHLTRIEHTTARRLSHAFRTGGAPVISV